MSSDAVIEAQQLTHTYGHGPSEITALRSVSLSLQKAELAAVMGPSGCGKSTLLQILGGLRNPTSGSVTVQGTNLYNLSFAQLARFRRQHIGFVFQFFNLIPYITVRQNVALPLMMDHMSLRHALPRVDSLLDRVGLKDRIHHRLGDLSGGELQRIAIARALVAKPEVILADEPTGNLDSAAGDQILALLRELAEQDQVSILLATHDASVHQYAHRIFNIRDGTLDDDIQENIHS